MKKVRIAFAIIIALVLYVVFAILSPAGLFKTITPHFKGIESKINLPIAGPEDFTIDQQTGLAFISVDDRRSNRDSPNSSQGGILLMDLSDSSKHLRNITPPINDFHPHGLSLWHEPDGRMFLFVVNHRENYSIHTIERFQWRNDSLVYLESIRDGKLMTSPNDVTAVGERTFYVTNDHGYSQKGLGRTLEDYLQRSISYVNYYNGNSFKKAAPGIAYANGINHSSNNSKIFVASTTGRKVYIYDRSLVTGELTLNQTINTKTGVDNIELDATGSLWIGCHPQMLKFVAHASNPNKFSPSQVIKLSPIKNGGYEQEEIFLNDGSTYSGSSVAAIYKNILLIGSVFENSILYCTYNSKSY